MVLLRAASVVDDFSRYDHTYTTNYAKWNGYVDRICVLKSIIDIRAASIFSSWKTIGTHDNTAAKILDGWEGRGNDTFKLIMSNMYKTAYICGDAYGEIIFDGDMPVDLEILSADTIQQVVENGKIVKYRETNTNMEWKPHQIFHLRYHPRGAMSHGIGQVSAMESILIDYEQMLQQGSEIFRLFTKPMQIVQAMTDKKETLTDIANQFKDSENTFSRTIVVPRNLIDKIDTISLSIPLQPGDWIKVLQAQIFMATQTPEIVLGTGYSTSEEDAKTRIAGFRGSIRYDQKWIEEQFRKQILEQMYPDNTPDIEFSFATEAQDERFNRSIEAAAQIQTEEHG